MKALMPDQPQAHLNMFLEQVKECAQFPFPGVKSTPYAETSEFQTGFREAVSIADAKCTQADLVNDVVSLVGDEYTSDIPPLWVLGYVTGMVFIMQQASLGSDQACL